MKVIREAHVKKEQQSECGLMLVFCQMRSSLDEGQYQIQGSNVLVVVDAMLLHQDDGVQEYRDVTQTDISVCRN